MNMRSVCTESARTKIAGMVLLVAASLVSMSVFSGCHLTAPESRRAIFHGPGVPFDLQGFIDQALAAGEKRIVIAPGRYRVTPRRHCHLRLRDLEHVTLIAKDVELVSYTGERIKDAKVLAIAADGNVTAEEQAFLLAQRMNQGTKDGLAKPNTEGWRLTLDRPVELPRGSVVCSTRRTGNGFLVKDCDFGYNRSRGILIKASNGQVVGNRLTGCWMSSVLVAPEWWWLESGSSCDVVIADNQITDCKGIAIDVIARGGNGAVAPSGAHRNITIRNNAILNSPLPNIHVTSTENLSIQNNRFTPLDSTFSRFRWGDKPPAAIVLESCAQTDIQSEKN